MYWVCNRIGSPWIIRLITILSSSMGKKPHVFSYQELNQMSSFKWCSDIERFLLGLYKVHFCLFLHLNEIARVRDAPSGWRSFTYRYRTFHAKQSVYKNKIEFFIMRIYTYRLLKSSIAKYCSTRNNGSFHCCWWCFIFFSFPYFLWFCMPNLVFYRQICAHWHVQWFIDCEHQTIIVQHVISYY